MSIGRNEACWCRSGLKYKNCHLEFDERLMSLKKIGCIVPTRELIKNKTQIEAIRDSAKINNGLLDIISENIREGISTEEIDELAYKYTISNGAIPATLNYDGYPKSLCISINEEVCHGIPRGDVILKNGDIVNVDVTTIFKGYYSDASRMFMIGDVNEEAKRLVKVAKECLEIGIKVAKPWGFLGDIGEAIQKHAQSQGYSVVRDFGGHGIGLKIHEEPFVCHFGKRGTDMVLAPGMVFTIEPMINQGSHRISIDRKDGWTVVTKDGLLSAQWENTVLITEEGVDIISA